MSKYLCGGGTGFFCSGAAHACEERDQEEPGRLRFQKGHFLSHYVKGALIANVPELASREMTSSQTTLESFRASLYRYYRDPTLYR